MATRGAAPYRAVLSHGFLLDAQGKAMSKSAGNGIEPEEIIKRYGADILRLWVAAADYRDDVRIGDEIVAGLAEGYRKIRNTIRWALGNLDGFDPATQSVPVAEMEPIDRWAVARLADWVAKAPDAIQVDWLALGLTLAIILFALYMMWQAWHGQSIPRFLMRINIVLVLGLAGIVVARYAGDPRLGGSEGYRRMVETIETQADPRDVLILNDDAQARYFFNTNRAHLKWYGLSRDPARWDAPTQNLVTRLGQEYSRVWFAYDDAVDAPNPMHDWLQENWQQLRSVSFDDDVSLELYAAH